MDFLCVVKEAGDTGCQMPSEEQPGLPGVRPRRAL